MTAEARRRREGLEDLPIEDDEWHGEPSARATNSQSSAEHPDAVGSRSTAPSSTTSRSLRVARFQDAPPTRTPRAGPRCR
jgi:hypothetical protein